MTAACEDLHAYIDGELDADGHARFERHLASCEACAAALPRLLALVSVVEAAAAAGATSSARLTLVGDPPADELRTGTGGTRGSDLQRANRRRRPLWIAGGVGVVLAAAGVLLLLRPPPQPAAPLVSLRDELGATRRLEGRFSYPGAEHHRKLDVARGARATEAISTDTIARLERARDLHGAAVASLLAGQRDRAAQLFAEAPSTAQADSDRAAFELSDGSYPALVRALDHVDRALAAAPGQPAALWNRALVLAALDAPLAAAEELDRVAALGEQGWADEARERAKALREATAARHASWRRASDAGRRLVEDGAPVPAELVAAGRAAGTLTVSLLDAVRAAPSRERALALRPLAAALDGAYRSDHLTAYVDRIAGSDFRTRKPLAEAYRELALRRLSGAAVGALLARLERPGAEDLRLGALAHAAAIGAHLDEYHRLAAASQNPWFAVIARHEAARAAYRAAEADGADEAGRSKRRAAVERQLREALELARRERLGYRALLVQDDLIKLHKAELKLSQAADEAYALYREATAAGEWGLEVGALLDLVSINQNRYANGLARAYATEVARRIESELPTGFNRAQECARHAYAYETLANVSLFLFDRERARAEASRVPRCPGAPSLVSLSIWSDLHRIGGRDEDARLARESIAALREAPSQVPGRDALLAYIEGSLVIDTDRDAGRRWLREAIAAAGTDGRELNVKARAYSYSLLAIDAGRASQPAEVIAILSETLGVPRPDRCAVAIAVLDERSVVAFADADGATGGQFVADRKTPALDVAALVPAGAVERLRACERVAVLARAPVLGTARILPPDLAWSYVLPGSPRTPAAAPGPRLVVGNPQTPPQLNLPPLGPLPAEPGPGVTLLRGAEATPTSVLLAMRDAATIELHTHGFLANDVSEASHLVLTPELDHQYTITARDVARVELTAAPLVVLGACHAAASSRSLEGGMGLPEAFRRAGARAVIASPGAVQDLGAHAFFTAVRERVLQGTSPAVAVRDERVRRSARSRDDDWVADVVVFE
jgi:cellulose synthase operon protein C